MIDSHCHLDRFIRDATLDPVLERARQAGVHGLVAVGTDRSDWGLYRKLAADQPDTIAFTAGLHPCHVDADWKSQLEDLTASLSLAPGPVAIGEIGLDYFRLPKASREADQVREWQELAFRQQLKLAQDQDLPVVVHSRGAFRETMAVLEDCRFDFRKVVFHCFAEGESEVRKLNSRGGWASFTGIVTYPSADQIRDALRAQGPSRLMVETDSPYLAPQSHRGKPNEPAWVTEVLARAADLLGLPLPELSDQVRANTLSFFDLPPSFGSIQTES